MRILVTVPWGERLGGAEGMLQVALDGAASHGHELEPVFMQDGSWPRELRARGFRVHVVEAGRLREARLLAGSIRRLAAIFRDRRPDLIVSWAAKTHLYGAPAAILAGMPGRLLWWQHAIPEPRGWLDECATLLPAKAIGCTSRAAARAQARMFPARRTFVVPAGTPPPGEEDAGAAAAASALELPDGVPVVGLVGRLQRWKGQDRMLRAQATLHGRGQRLHLLIVGGDSYELEPGYARSLPELVGSLGLSGAVTMTGQVPDAGPFIGRMDVLVNASDPEPFGIVLLEGMARGVPVLAVDAGGPADIISDGDTGALARSGSPEDIADALAPLLASSELRTRLGRAGHESYLSEYTDAAMQQRLYGALEALAGGR